MCVCGVRLAINANLQFACVKNAVQQFLLRETQAQERAGVSECRTLYETCFLNTWFIQLHEGDSEQSTVSAKRVSVSNRREILLAIIITC